MPEIRLDSLTGEWVIVAPERARRPDSFGDVDAAGSAGRTGPTTGGEGRSRSDGAIDPACPFCPGNEDRTTAEVWRTPAGDGRDWQVRVIPSKYPALDLDPEVDPLAAGLLDPDPGGAPTVEAVGIHEVIIETPRHDHPLADFDDGEIQALLEAYRDRFTAAAADPRVRHVVLFRNRGPGANASQAHPHSQLIGLPLVPPAIRRRLERARDGSSLQEIVKRELASGARILGADDRFVTFVPWAASHEYEIWIAPRGVPADFGDVRSGDLVALGLALRRALRALRGALDDPDYNCILQAPPLLDDAADVLSWYLQIIPRMTTIAGFELGVGLQIVSTRPEEAARRLRGHWQDG